MYQREHTWHTKNEINSAFYLRMKRCKIVCSYLQKTNNIFTLNDPSWIFISKKSVFIEIQYFEKHVAAVIQIQAVHSFILFLRDSTIVYFWLYLIRNECVREAHAHTFVLTLFVYSVHIFVQLSLQPNSKMNIVNIGTVCIGIYLWANT